MSVEIPPHEPVPEEQLDSVTIISNPVSGLKYEWKTGESGAGAVLGSQKNVRIIDVSAQCTQSVNPDSIQVHITCDTKLNTYTKATPATNTMYASKTMPHLAATAQQLDVATNFAQYRAFLKEGRTIKVEAEVTGGTVTELKLRVKWGKW